MISTLRPKRLALAIMAVVGLAFLAVMTGCTVETAAEIKAINGINDIRVQNGMPPLKPDPELTKIARIRSQDMAARGYFSHDPPDGCNYACLMDTYGIGKAYAGENIAWNTYDWKQTADVAVDMWHNSPPHMKNILNCNYTRFGTGVAKAADGKIYYTMIFEGPGC